MADHSPIDIIRSREEEPQREKPSTDSQHLPEDQPAQPREEGVCEKEPAADVPPDGGYGWVCVACISTINGHTWGINSVSQAQHSTNCTGAPVLIPTCLPRLTASFFLTISLMTSSTIRVISNTLSSVV